MQTNTCPYLVARARVDRLEAAEADASAAGRRRDAAAFDASLSSAHELADAAIPATLESARLKLDRARDLVADWASEDASAADWDADLGEGGTRALVAQHRTAYDALTSAARAWDAGESFVADLRAAAGALKGDAVAYPAAVIQTVLAGAVAASWLQRAA
ncbi:hypothetical protein CKO28_16450 [Rhodovibrio sodomensis]|uniref:Uncharacterized protein n=1 Tax=Rhodovibrio sodomensis TaxID=1088 RepID=A0ABS1DGN1_9PROT|nr:hypothetical protein [Rhodovibrio sodomensis]MBK1669631.1 hypothetical protein [Rhodovibrio sodomensis]